MATAWNARNTLVRATLLRDRVPSFERYPFSIPAIRDLDELDFERPVTFLVGENGEGQVHAAGGDRGRLPAQPRGRQPQPQLFDLRLALDAGRSSAAGPQPTPDPGQPRPACREPLQRRHRDRAPRRRGQLWRPFAARAVARGVLPCAVHEPAARCRSLPARRAGGGAVAVVVQVIWAPLALHDLVGMGAQVLIATHPPILMAYPDADILLLADGPPRRVAYHDTEHYQVTRNFLIRTETMLDTAKGSASGWKEAFEPIPTTFPSRMKARMEQIEIFQQVVASTEVAGSAGQVDVLKVTGSAT